VPDLEYSNADPVEGAWMEFVLAPGPVSCASLYDTGSGYRMTVFDGESLVSECRMDGWAHGLVRPQLPVADLLPRLVQLGMTQHFAVVHGRPGNLLEKYCGLSGIEYSFQN
jgi:hypothetical protein